MLNKTARHVIMSLSALGVSMIFIMAFATDARASEVGNRWQGPYIGALVGGSYVAAVVERDSDLDDRTFNDRELVGGLFLGYNFETPSPQWLLGVEADLTYANHNLIQSDPVLDMVQLRHKWAGSIRARGGYIRYNDFFLYGTIGWIRSDLEIEPENLGPHDAIRDGIIIGLGGEQAVGDHWMVRVEGLAAFYPDDKIGFAGTERKVEHHQSTIRFGIGRRF